MASFEKTVFKNGSAPYLSDTVLNALQDKINNALKGATDLVDYTSQVTAINGSFAGGKVYKIGRVAYWQINYMSSETNSWGDICSFPSALEPLTPNSGNIYMAGVNVSIYNNSGTHALKICGGKKNESENLIGLVFSYITKT